MSSTSPTAAENSQELRRVFDLQRAHQWDVKASIVMQKTGGTYAGALKKLKQADDSVRVAIGGEDIEPRLKELLGIS